MADNAGTATAAPPQATPKAEDASKTPAPSQPAQQTQTQEAPKTDAAKPAQGAAEPQKTLLGTEKEAPKAEEKPAPQKADYSKLKLPDGSVLKPADLDAAKAFAEKHGMSAEAAQAYLEDRNGAVKGYHESLLASHKEAVAKNEQALRSHPTYGGDHLKATNDAMTGVMKRFGSDKLMQRVIAGGFNWDPDFADFLMKVHDATRDDKLVTSGQNPVQKGRTLEDMYKGNAK